MKMPTKGFTIDLGPMRDPKKIGKIMWCRSDSGEMVPADLREILTSEDRIGCNRVFEKMLTFRSVSPAVETVQNWSWESFKELEPYLRMSLEGRSEARSLISSGDWSEIWSDLMELHASPHVRARAPDPNERSRPMN